MLFQEEFYIIIIFMWQNFELRLVVSAVKCFYFFLDSLIFVKLSLSKLAKYNITI